MDVDMSDEDEEEQERFEEVEAEMKEEFGDSAVVKKGSHLYQVRVRSKDIRLIKEQCAKVGLPLIEEYDFKRDSITPDMKIELKSTTFSRIRDYQEQSLSKMFSNGRARSGIIVLPCGAGKTLTGITAASHIKKSTLVLCNSGVAAQQWRQEFCKWANLSRLPILFTSKSQGDMFEPSEAGIVISTYSMITYDGKRNDKKQIIMD